MSRRIGESLEARFKNSFFSFKSRVIPLSQEYELLRKVFSDRKLGIGILSGNCLHSYMIPYVIIDKSVLNGKNIINF